MTSDLGGTTDMFGGGGVGGAGLMGALDIMAFSNDVDLPAAASTGMVSKTQIDDIPVGFPDDPLKHMVRAEIMYLRRMKLL